MKLKINSMRINILITWEIKFTLGYLPTVNMHSHDYFFIFMLLYFTSRKFFFILLKWHTDTDVMNLHFNIYFYKLKVEDSNMIMQK